jgi:hypothetical protein
LDFSYLERLDFFSVTENGGEPHVGSRQQNYVAIEQPGLSLASVVAGMLRMTDCFPGSAIRKKYAVKVVAVLRIIVRCLRYLHSQGMVHGNVHVDTCGKYEETWKLSESWGITKSGEAVQAARLVSALPPEVVSRSGVLGTENSILEGTIVAEESIDVWAFGKTAYESLTGRSLLNIQGLSGEERNHVLADIAAWSDSNLNYIKRELSNADVTSSFATLIASCLAPLGRDRPSAAEILGHPSWKEMRSTGTN